MTCNDANGFKRHLWSLFLSYSYLPSKGGRGGTPSPRRISEGGYRAIMALLANIDVMYRFFAAEDEITQREGIGRMESERFRDEVWEEMVRADERLLGSTGSAGGGNICRNEEEEIKNIEEEYSEMARTSCYDMVVMQPPVGHMTVRWNVFNAVLLLRMSGSLHLSIHDDVLQRCREALNPPAWLLLQSPREEPAREYPKETPFSPEDHSSHVKEELIAATAVRLSATVSAKESTTQSASTVWNSFSRESSKRSIRHETSLPDRDSLWKGMQSIPTPLSNSLRGQRHGVGSGKEKLSPVPSGPCALLPSSSVRTGECTPNAASSVGREDVKNASTVDAKPHKSSPPPRPQRPSINAPNVFRPAHCSSARGKNIALDMNKLNQRLAHCDENQLPKTDVVVDTLVTDSKRSTVSESRETVLEMWKSPHMPTNNTSSAGMKSHAVYGPHWCDKTANKHHNVQSEDSKRFAESSLKSPFSPSPNVEEIIGVKGIMVSPTLNDPPIHFLLPKEARRSDKENISPDARRNDVTLKTSTHVNKNAMETKTNGAITNCEEARKETSVVLFHPRHATRRQPLPPGSPSRRALSRVLYGPRPATQPIVPRTRAPQSSRNSFRTETLTG